MHKYKDHLIPTSYQYKEPSKMADSNCTIFLSNIPLRMTSMQLNEFLENILHNPPISSLYEGMEPEKEKMNFHLRVLKLKSEQPLGLLTLPNPIITKAVLARYSRITVCGRTMYLQQSNKPSDQSIINKLRASEYIGLAQETIDIEEAFKITQTQICNVTLKFGKTCYDQVFSIEAEYSVGIDIKFAMSPLRILLFNSLENIRMEISESIIHSVTFDGNLMIHFELQYAGTFKTKNTSGTWLRTSSFSKHKNSLAQYFNIEFIIEFLNQNDVHRFLEILSSKWNFKPRKESIETAQRFLYSEPLKQVFEDWLTTLPFPVSFQLEALLSNQILHLKEICMLKEHIENLLVKYKANDLEKILLIFQDKLYGGQMYTDGNLKDELLACLTDSINIYYKYEKHEINYDVFHEIRKVIVTPTQFILQGPFIDLSNRVIRQYLDNMDCFIRLSFAEEGEGRIFNDSDTDFLTFLKNRFGNILHSGILIGGRHFEFLGYSNSALREHCVYLVTPFKDKSGQVVDAHSIRSFMGDFSKESYFPARYGARLSQLFTATFKAALIPEEQLLEIPDIFNEKKECFTDGVGIISYSLAKKALKIIQQNSPSIKNFMPSAIQIRLAGLKGMLTIDNTIKGDALCWRQSMNKFSANPPYFLEIAKAFTNSSNCFLSRQLIKILEDLEVPIQVFLDLQKNCVDETLEAAKNLISASNLLETYSLGNSFGLQSLFQNLVQVLNLKMEDVCGIDGIKGFKRIVEYSIYEILRDLKHRSRIPVKGSYSLVGIADEWNHLKEGEIFACAYDPVTGKTDYLKGSICISKAPCLHPGDVQMVQAIGECDVPGLMSIRNAVVFSAKSDQNQKPLANCLSGGDLDGDEYLLIANPLLFPKFTMPPADYLPAEKFKLDRPCKISDVADFVIQYIANDILGLVCNRHVVLSDLQKDGTLDQACIKLAELASIAVDYQKSGTSVKIVDIPNFKSDYKPDFLTHEIPSKYFRSYPSKKALGVLYRAVDLPDIKKPKRSSKRVHKQIDNSADEIANLLSDILLNKQSTDCVSRKLKELFPFLEHFESKKIPQKLSVNLNMFLTEISLIATRIGSYILGRKLIEPELLLGICINDSKHPRKRREMMINLRLETMEARKMLHNRLLNDEDSFEDKIRCLWAAWKFSLFSHKYGSLVLRISVLQMILELYRKV